MTIRHLQPQVFYVDPKITATQPTDIQTAWQYIITGDLATAADFLHESQCALEAGQAPMADFQAIQINHSILDLLKGNFFEAEQGLRLCFQLCQPTLEPLLFHTLKLYQCYGRLHHNVAKNRASVQTELQECLSWFHIHGIDYLPTWWHPAIMSNVLVFAIAHNIYPQAAEQLLDHQNAIYGESFALVVLRTYNRCQDLQIRRNISAMLQHLEPDAPDLLACVGSGRV